VNPGFLCVHHPGGTGKENPFVTTRRVDPLATDTWYTLRWRITEQGQEVFVNEKRVLSDKRTYDLSNKQPVLVYTSQGSVVDVKSIVVTPISGSKPAETTPVPAPTPVVVQGEVRRFEVDSSDVRSVAFSPDGTRALSCQGRFLTHWDVNKGTSLRRMDLASGSVMQAAFLPDGRRAIVRLVNKTLSLIDLDTGKKLW
jgi:WD40 repeat protein